MSSPLRLLFAIGLTLISIGFVGSYSPIAIILYGLALIVLASYQIHKLNKGSLSSCVPPKFLGNYTDDKTYNKKPRKIIFNTIRKWYFQSNLYKNWIKRDKQPNDKHNCTDKKYVIPKFTHNIPPKDDK